MSATGQLAGEPADDEVDLVGVLPGIRGDLGDGERLDHARQGYGPARPSSARVVRSRSRRPSTPPSGKRRVTASARPDGGGVRLAAAGLDLAPVELEQSCRLAEAAGHFFESGLTPDVRCARRRGTPLGVLEACLGGVPLGCHQTVLAVHGIEVAYGCSVALGGCAGCCRGGVGGWPGGRRPGRGEWVSCSAAWRGARGLAGRTAAWHCGASG